VPRRETECFCGAKQLQSEQHYQRQEQRKSTKIPLDVAGIVLLIVLVGVWAVHHVTQSEADNSMPGAANVLGAALATPEPGPAQPVPVAPTRAPQQQAAAEPSAFQKAPEPPMPPATQPAAAEAPRLATPAPAPTPTPFDERAQVRAAGLAAYEAALQRLVADAASLDQHVRTYKTECSDAQKFAYAIGNCPEIESTVKREASQIQQGLDGAEDQARRAWLEPGQVRDARGRSFFGTREWDELLSSARNLKR
jgi:hypothetical protein